MEGYESKEVFIVKQIADMLDESGNMNGAASLRLFADTFELIVKENNNLKKSIESKWMNGLLGLADKALDGRFEEMQEKHEKFISRSNHTVDRLCMRVASLKMENEALRKELDEHLNDKEPTN